MAQTSAMQQEIQAAIAPMMKDLEARLRAHMEDVLIDKPEWVSTVDAAKQLGLCEKTIRNHVKAKKLKGKIVANRYFVHASEL